MKIYEIGTGYTPIPAKIGAATELIVEELTRSFISNGEDAEIIDISCSEREEFDLPLREVKVPSVFSKKDVSLGIVHKLKRVVYSIALARELKRILKNTSEKVVLHFHNQYNAFFFFKLVPEKYRKKALVAYTNHNGYWNLSWEEAYPILKSRYFQEIDAVKKSDVVFVLNERTAEYTEKHFDVDRKRIFVVANGVNCDEYAPISEEEKIKIREKYGLVGKEVILQVGSVYENKGQGKTVELIAPYLKNNQNAVFAYVGGIVSDEYFETVKKTASDLGVDEQVVYLGAASPGAEMNGIYNIADATVFVSRYEAFGLVAIESLAASVPVIVCSDNVRNFGDGCTNCRPDEFVNAIGNLYAEDNLALKQRCRDNAIGNYGWQKIAKDHSDVFYTF